MSNKTATIFYGGYLHKAGGAFNHARILDEELEKLGWKTKIITLDRLPIWCRFFPHIAERLVNLFCSPLGFYYKGVITKYLYQLFFSSKVDLNVFEDIYLSWNSSVKSITLLHAVWSDNLHAYKLDDSRINKLKIKELDLINKIEHPIATVSSPYLEYLSNEHFPTPPKNKIHVILLGLAQVYPENFQNIDKVAKSIVYSGTLEARKNVLFLLKVFKAIYAKDNQYRLTVIGDGPERQSLQAFSVTHALPVSFLGKIEHDKVIDELAKHSICLHPSTKESFSFTLLEAKLCGLKTFAHSGLQVPKDFIDVGFNQFETELWSKGVLENTDNAKPINLNQYSAESMATLTLKLANS